MNTADTAAYHAAKIRMAPSDRAQSSRGRSHGWASRFQAAKRASRLDAVALDAIYEDLARVAQMALEAAHVSV